MYCITSSSCNRIDYNSSTAWKWAAKISRIWRKMTFQYVKWNIFIPRNFSNQNLWQWRSIRSARDTIFCIHFYSHESWSMNFYTNMNTVTKWKLDELLKSFPKRMSKDHNMHQSFPGAFKALPAVVNAFWSSTASHSQIRLIDVIFFQISCAWW